MNKLNHIQRRLQASLHNQEKTNWPAGGNSGQVET